MQRPPPNANAQLFSGATLWLALLQGIGVLVVVMGAYAWAGHRLGEPEARAFAFTTLVVANLALIYINRSRTQTLLAALFTPNPILWIVTGATLGFLALALYLPFLTGVFRFAPLAPAELVTAFALGLVSVLCVQWLKVFRSAKRHEPAPQP
jgi:Ca2+-transporting ATPase